MIKKAEITDVETLSSLAVLMWDSHTPEELEDEFLEIMQDKECVKEAQFFLKYENGEPVGFAQCQLRRDYVEGTETTPVGYLEGIFVKESFRHKGYAKELLQECEAWARSKGCMEFASDCELGNIASLSFHLNVGFEEANRIICFTKKL